MASPVLYGYTTTKDIYSHANGTVIDELVTGLSVVKATAAPGNTCPSVSDTLAYAPLLFGYDSVTGCTLQLNRWDLRRSLLVVVCVCECV